MKKWLLILSGLLIWSVSSAQDENESMRSGGYEPATLLRNGGRPTGGFFSPTVRVTEVNEQTAMMIGAQLAVVLGHQFNVGLVANVMLSEVELYGFSPQPPQYYLPPPPRFLEMGYAGLLLEPVFFDKSLVHFTVPTVVGVGLGSRNYYRVWESGYYDYQMHKSDLFFVLEPGVNLEVNIARPLRLFAGGAYRFVLDSDLMYEKSDAALSGFSLNIGLKAGWF